MKSAIVSCFTLAALVLGPYAPAALANLSNGQQLEVELTPPTNQAYKLETSSNLVQWTQEAPVYFGIGQPVPHRVTLAPERTGYVRLALLGQPPNVGPAPWQLPVGQLNTFLESGGTPGVVIVRPNTSITFGITTTPPVNPVAVTSLRTAAECLLIKEASAPSRQLSLKYATPGLGVFSYTTNDHMTTRRGVFTTSSLSTQPTSLAPHTVVFIQNGEDQVLFGPETTIPPAANWKLLKAGTSYFPTVTHTAGQGTATISLVYRDGHRDETTLTYNGSNGGTFRREEIRQGNLNQVVTGAFAVK